MRCSGAGHEEKRDPSPCIWIVRESNAKFAAVFNQPSSWSETNVRASFEPAVWIVLVAMLTGSTPVLAATLLTAGIATAGTNIYPNPKKPVFGSPINWSRSLSTGLVSALPLNEGDGTNFNDAVTLQPCLPRRLSGTLSSALPPSWFTPAATADYPWGGRALSNNGGAAQAIQSPFLESNFINNVTNGYSYAMLVQPLDTNTFGRVMDASGAAVITMYLNLQPGQVATTWRNSQGTAIVPHATIAPNKWTLVLCTVQQGLGVMYVNGLPATNDTQVDLAASWANQSGQLVYNATGNGSQMPNASFSSWWVWNNRVLTAQEAAQMYANPWVMFHSGSQKGFIKGTKVTLSQAALVSNVWFYSHAAGGNVRLAIYDNSSPKRLLWQSGVVTNTASESWLKTPVAQGSPSILSLVPGVYWLTWQVETLLDVPGFTQGPAGNGFFVNQTFGAFPASLSNAQSSSETWSMYFDYTTASLFTGIAFQPGGSLQLKLLGDSNTTFALLASTNLKDWSRLNIPASASNGLWFFTDTNAGKFPRRFYRAVSP